LIETSKVNIGGIMSTETLEQAYVRNMAIIAAFTDEERHEWYLRIKESLPKLQKIYHDGAIEKAILEYERKHGIV